MAGTRTKRKGKRTPRRRARKPGYLGEALIVLVLISVVGGKLAYDAAVESSAVELLWFAGEVGYHLAAAEEVLHLLLP